MEGDQDPNLNNGDAVNGGAGNDGGIQSPPEGDGKETAPAATVTIDGKEYSIDQVKANLQKAVDYDNLLPDYTRKSQKLAEIEKAKESTQAPQERTELKAPYHDPKWEPKTMAELREAILKAEEMGEQRAVAQLQAREQALQEANKQVDVWTTEKKGADATFDEDVFFKYVARHKFPVRSLDDLNLAYGVWKESAEAVKTAEQRALANKQQRQGSTPAAPGGAGSGGAVDYKEISNAPSAFSLVRDAMQALKK